MNPELAPIIARRLIELEVPERRVAQATGFLAEGCVLITIDKPGCPLFCAWALRPESPYRPTLDHCLSEFRKSCKDAGDV